MYIILYSLFCLSFFPGSPALLSFPVLSQLAADWLPLSPLVISLTSHTTTNMAPPPVFPTPTTCLYKVRATEKEGKRVIFIYVYPVTFLLLPPAVK